MATQRVAVVPQQQRLVLSKVASFSRLRVLSWRNSVLYASHGYKLLRTRASMAGSIEWRFVGQFRPAWWRKLSCGSRLSMRLCRDGFHALAVTSSGHLVAAVPGAIVMLAPGEEEFRLSQLVIRGTRPLHIAVTPQDHIFWGEYFDNRQRDEVHVYASSDCGLHWDVAYTFPKGAIRHVHNIVYDQWANCLWVLTGDLGEECRILRASCDFRDVQVVLSGTQRVRTAALVPTADAVYFSSDTPLEANHVYRLDRRRNLNEVGALNSSSICGCGVGESLFFSTMVEPSQINGQNQVCVYGSQEGSQWSRVLQWKKDRWPMGLFQYGNAFLPDGNNTTDLLAVTTVAVRKADWDTTLWRVSSV